ncbi:MAG: fused uroporphyrinogen-III synthase HemD/membrane protein HemX [Burkholderiaceae bacterium]|nr:MAG: fused uroporphyrinogen-III synthase HemD/membrane protein HemX [Burkholderiaceae bacterium]
MNIELQPPLIVNTRPTPQAAALTARLRAQHLEVFESPAIEILPIEDLTLLRAALANLAQYQLVVFVSPNAIAQVLAHWQGPWPAATAIGVMGPGSRAALQGRGLTDAHCTIISPQHVDETDAENLRFDSESLLKQLNRPDALPVPLAQARVLVLRGTQGRDLIVEQLHAQGAQVDVVACYQRRAAVFTAAQQAQWHALAQRDRPLILIATSSEGLRNMCAAVDALLGQTGRAWLRRQTIVAPHPRIAEQAKQLGFANIRLSGAGDDSIVEKIVALTTLAAAPAQTNPGKSNTGKISNHRTSSAREMPHMSNKIREVLTQWKSTQWLLLILVALLVLQFIWSRQQVDSLQHEVARRSQESQSMSMETQSYARTAQDLAREMQDRLAVLEANIAQSRSQQAALEQLYQDLSRSRDEWALSEIEQILSVASQQLQLAGNVQGAIIALQAADARLARADRPQFLPLRRVLARDIERLKVLPFVDLAGITLKIDTLIGTIDNLPALADARPPQVKPKEKTPAAPPVKSGKPGDKPAAAISGLENLWQKTRVQIAAAWDEMQGDLSNLIQVRKVEQDDALFLMPEQVFYLREHLKLRLLNARLSVLSRNEAAYRADLRAATVWVEKYFDTSQHSVIAAEDTLKQLQASTIVIELPSLSDSLNAVRNFKPVQNEKQK